VIKNIRRYGALLLAIALFMGLTCGVSAQKKTTIVHWQHHSPARLETVKAFAQEFMKENPNVKIEIESVPQDDFFQKLLPAIAAGSGPDTFQIPLGQVPAYAASGVIQPIDSRVATTRQIESEFITPAIKRMKHNGKYYGFPVDVQTIVLFYNPKLFKEAGLDPERPPQTWDELIKYAQAIHKRDAKGITTQMGVGTGGYGPTVITLMLQNGAPLWNTKTQLPDFNSPQAIEALKFVTDLETTYKVEDAQFGRRNDMFRQGKVGMVFGHPAMIGANKTTAPNLEFRTAEIPAPKAGGSRATLLTSWAYVVSSQAESEICSKWVAYLTSAEAQKRWTLTTGELPSRKALLDLPEYKNDILLAPCMESMKKSVPAPWTARRLDDELIRETYQLITLKGESPAAALKWLTKEAVKAEKEQQELAKP